MWDVTHSFVRHDPFLCPTWLVTMWDVTHSCVGHDSFLCGTWLVTMWDVTHSYVGHDSFICGTWLIPIWDMTRYYMGRDSFIWCHVVDNVSYPMTHSVCHNSWHIQCVIFPWLIDAMCYCQRVISQDSLIHIHSKPKFEIIYTGWRRLIGSPNLQIIFHKRATKYGSLLRKMTYKDKGSYESLPLYNPPPTFSTKQSVGILLISPPAHTPPLPPVQPAHETRMGCIISRRSQPYTVAARGTSRCNTLLHTATHCNTLQHTATHCNILWHTVTYCDTQQHTATHCYTLPHTAIHCNTLWHTVTYCDTQQRTVTHCYTLLHTATHCNTLLHTVTYCDILWHAATHCDTLLHTATYCHTL